MHLTAAQRLTMMMIIAMATAAAMMMSNVMMIHFISADHTSHHQQ